jgi:hypothetical protein
MSKYDHSPEDDRKWQEIEMQQIKAARKAADDKLHEHEISITPAKYARIHKDCVHHDCVVSDDD